MHWNIDVNVGLECQSSLTTAAKGIRLKVSSDLQSPGCANERHLKLLDA